MENLNNLTDQEIRELANRLADARGSIKQGTSNFSGALADFDQASASAEETAYQISQGMSTFGQGMIQFTKALVDSKSDLNKYSAGVEAITDGIGDIVGAFGPLSMIFGALIKVVGKLTTEVLKQDQIYLDAYDALANFGGVSGLSADQLKEKVSQLKDNQYTLPILVKATTSLGTSIMSMGKTAGEAQEAFFDLANVSQDTIQQYGRLGISQEKLTQIQADYIKQQSKVGLINTKSMGDLRQKSLDYAKNLVTMSALTGQSIDQLKEARERDLLDYKYAATERELLEKGQDDVVKRMQSTLNFVRGTFGETFTSGFREIFATGLANQTEGARTLNQVTGGAIINWMAQRKAGTMGDVELMEKVKDSLENYIKTNGYSLKASEMHREIVQGLAEAMRGLSKKTGNVADVQGSITERMEKGKDPLLDLRAESNQITSALQKAFESFIQLIAGPINYAFTGLLHGIKALGQGLLRALSFVGAVPEDLEFMFMSYEELSAAQADLVQRIGVSTQLQEANNSAVFRMGTASQFPMLSSALGAGGEDLESLKKRLAVLEKVKTGMAPPAAAPAAAPAPAGAPTQGFPITQPPQAAPAAPAAPKPPETIRIGSNQGFSKGGVTDGPMSGHLGLMHDLEAVVPLPDGRTIPVTLNIPQLSEKQKNPLLDTGNLAAIIESYAKALTKVNNSTAQATFVQESTTDFGFINIISERMETLIASMKTNTSLQSELLYYAKR